ncbi:uncharacterized protein LODBEIA_P13810 [Lodderomyces beijingensis]|uniref:Cytochrome c oxidase assembly protein COX16, mitochondrial n=1 Tax=Lodderomyces beijingensis TaxID=1775926 RepID=A0ABP0ZLT1_9ASCO
MNRSTHILKRFSSYKTPSFKKKPSKQVKVTSTSTSTTNTAAAPHYTTNPPRDSPFVQELLVTGRPNWSKAPPQLKKRYNGIFLIFLSVPILAMTTYEMVSRLEGNSTKKIQQGEMYEDGTRRDFSESEKYKVERESLMYRIFGKDFFLDGFTSRTMKGQRPDEKQEQDQNQK